jgi:hypothetical protein
MERQMVHALSLSLGARAERECDLVCVAGRTMLYVYDDDDYVKMKKKKNAK